MFSISMSRLIFPSILASCLLFGACAKHSDDMQTGNHMDVDVNFLEIHRCSRISPEMHITNSPKGTEYYDVRLMEEGKQSRYLGGGVWREDGSGVIPEGALTRHYTGPCPQADQEVEFVYVISAMDEDQGQPLEVRLYRFKPD